MPKAKDVSGLEVIYRDLVMTDENVIARRTP
jgi:hypothetical protein